MSSKNTQNMIPKGDVSFVGATSHNFVPVSPSGMGKEKAFTPLSQVDSDWDDQDEIRLRELEEARARAAQMEKTMRWWSDCTANWREKWSKVRNERNKAREENRHFRSKLETLAKECALLKRDKQQLCNETEHLKKKLNLFDRDDNEDKGLGDELRSELTSVGDRTSVSDTSAGGIDIDKVVSEAVLKSIPQVIGETRQNNKPARTRPGEDLLMSPRDENLADEKLALLELKLAEAQKTIQAERDEKCFLNKSFEKIHSDLSSMKSLYEDLKLTKQETLVELTKLREEHKDELGRMTLDLEDESSSRSTMDRRLFDLRKELERLQTENAAEWGKRERLETEKLSMERENKKLRVQISDLDDQLERKNEQASALMDSDMRTLQFEFSEKNKELNDLRHSHAKLKKALQERTTELDHMKRRGEQYEQEVKKLRARVEELKRNLAASEDEVDTQTNNVRRLQRTTDELQEQNENLTIQVDHMQMRLQRKNESLLGTRSSSIKSFSGNELDDIPNSDNDLDDDLE